MDEQFAVIWKESGRMISKLHLLAVFFENEVIYKIYLRTQLIHQLFEQDKQLKVHQLEFFHAQFTSALIDLLKKIKQNNEQQVMLLLNEIELNKALILQLQQAVFTAENYLTEAPKQAFKVGVSLRRLYQILSDNTGEYPFSKNINSFSARFSRDFYTKVLPELWLELAHHQPNEVYTNAYASIQKKLMGQLCKHDFKLHFFCGITCGNMLAEVYKIAATERFLMFLPAQNSFMFCDIEKINKSRQTDQSLSNEKLMRELNDKNTYLQTRVSISKTHLPQEIKTLLMENYKKISEIDFTDAAANFDVQVNILKAMLQTGLD